MVARCGECAQRRLGARRRALRAWEASSDSVGEMTRRPVQRAPSAFEIRALRATDGPVVEALFGANGACGGCWCMWARLPRGGKLWEQSKGEPNRRAQLELVRGGASHALLAIDDGAAIGWCSLGPRGDFPRLERVKAARSRWDANTWSVVCFFIPARRRGQGLASALLDAAIEYAREHGARELEGYPVRGADGAGQLMPAAFSWTGVVSMFERRGFVRQSPRGARELWTLALTPLSKSRRTRRSAASSSATERAAVATGAAAANRPGAATPSSAKRPASAKLTGTAKRPAKAKRAPSASRKGGPRPSVRKRSKRQSDRSTGRG